MLPVYGILKRSNINISYFPAALWQLWLA